MYWNEYWKIPKFESQTLSSEYQDLSRPMIGKILCIGNKSEQREVLASKLRGVC